jgi:hypothetical protein
MNAKDRHRRTILEYLGNPENEFCSRTDIAVKVLGFKFRQRLYQVFTPCELADIEAKALEIRRKKYASSIALVDSAMLREAAAGSVKAAQLVYQRLEGWNPKEVREVTGKDGQPLGQNPADAMRTIMDAIALTSSKSNGIPEPLPESTAAKLAATADMGGKSRHVDGE